MYSLHEKCLMKVKSTGEIGEVFDEFSFTVTLKFSDGTFDDFFVFDLESI